MGRGKEVQGVFVTATDTGVGKTVVSSCLCYKALEQGKKVLYLKPVQTGSKAECPEDPVFVKKALESFKSGYFDAKAIYTFELPASPHLASKVEKKEISPKLLVKEVFKNLSENDFTVVEGAGGVMVPITEDYLMIDLIKDLNLPVVVVARTKLGTINHTLLTLEALRLREIKVLGVIFNLAEEPLSIVEEDSIAIIKKLAKLEVLGVLKKVKSLTPELPRFSSAIKLPLLS